MNKNPTNIVFILILQFLYLNMIKRDCEVFYKTLVLETIYFIPVTCIYLRYNVALSSPTKKKKRATIINT